MEYKDYYKILGVERSASQDELKKAYRRLARKYHPDVSKEKDAETGFKEVNEAYEVLKDSEKRQAYDQLGANWKAGQDFRPPPGWEQAVHFNAGGAGAGMGGFSDFFESLFGGGFRRGTGRAGGVFRSKGADQYATIRLGLEDAYHGGSKTVRLSGGKALQVKIPRGVSDGKQIRLSGQGAPGTGGAPSGDLYLKVTIEPHAYFKLDGKDILLELPIAP